MDNIKEINALFWRGEYYGAITEGGMPATFHGLVSAFNKLGYRYSFVTSGKMILPNNKKYYYIPYSKLLRNFPEVLNLPYNEKSYKEVLKIIETENPDFIYQFQHDFMYSGAKIKKETGLPFILQAEGVQQWTKKNWGRLFFPYLLKWAEEIQWEWADAIFVVSENVKKLMMSYGVPDEKIHVKISAVDPDVFNPDINSKVREKYNIEDRFICGFTGTFAQWHGVDVLAEAVKHIVNLIPNAVVLFIGDGILKPKIEEIIKKDNMNDHAILTGLLPMNKMPEYLAACDVLLSPCVNNSDTEFFNSPIKLFEYLAMGKPIVASEVGQQGEVIKHKENGLLCEENSPEDLAEKIHFIYKNPDIAEKISRNARIDAVEKYDWRVNVKKIIDVYQSIANK